MLYCSLRSWEYLLFLFFEINFFHDQYPDGSLTFFQTSPVTLFFSPFKHIIFVECGDSISTVKIDLISSIPYGESWQTDKNLGPNGSQRFIKQRNDIAPGRQKKIIPSESYSPVDVISTTGSNLLPCVTQPHLLRFEDKMSAHFSLSEYFSLRVKLESG
jgi:hypothetical protein